MKLRIFYDSHCPLCDAEMQQIKQLDSANHVELQDLNQAEFETRFPYIDAKFANRILHAELADGTLIKGLDVTYRAWDAVGKGRWFAFLRAPFIKPVADLGYLFFAKHRYRISYLLTGKRRCKAGTCSR
ncbi:DUF393 domain-containing protein [Shewanella sp. Isolate13]|uniref:thiol-disulfide oxidoreductase DCC family protein n=1 Tax=Shewanella sp. Isolate13 TaxID=2908531 RepID=UPI001EFE0F77|nr:DUF393 domain-containing protein [Shewanella sp. Isolate13]MCG9731445.1 DUF393 domain-containing protein [Shewanella sp. Isolate13]